MSEAIAEAPVQTAPFKLIPSNHELVQAEGALFRAQGSINYYRDGVARQRRAALRYSRRAARRIQEAVKLLNDNPSFAHVINAYRQHMGHNGAANMEMFRAYLLNRSTANNREFQSHYEQYRSLKARYFNTLDVIADAKQRVARAKLFPPKEPVIDPDTVIANLLKHPNIDKVTTHQHPHNFICFSLHLHKMYMDPSSPNYEEDAIKTLKHFDCFPDTRIPLDDMVISFIIHAGGSWSVSVTRGTFVLGYDKRFLIHPHWISESDPCYGDWDEPILAAVRDGDAELAINLLIMFLKQYNPHDSAGAYFWTWRAALDHELPVLPHYHCPWEEGDDGEDTGDVDETYPYEDFLRERCETYYGWGDYRL